MSTYLTFRVDGRTQTLYVPVDLEKDVRSWSAQYKKLKEQIAHILAQLTEKGLLAKDLADTIGGLRNVARLLWEDLRRGTAHLEELERYLHTPIQIRFADTS